MLGSRASRRVKLARNFFAGSLLLFACATHAAPRVVEPTAVWGPSLGFGRMLDAAIDGNRIVTLEDPNIELGVWDRDSAGVWTRTATLPVNNRGSVDVSGNLIALYNSTDGLLYIFEFNGSQWHADDPIQTIGDVYWAGGRVRIDHGRVYVGVDHEVRVFEKSASGTWSNTGSMSGGATRTDNSGAEYGTDTVFDVSGDSLLISGLVEAPHDYRGFVFNRSGANWTLSAQLQTPQEAGGSFGLGGISSDIIGVDGWHDGFSTFKYSSGAWNYVGTAVNPNYGQTAFRKYAPTSKVAVDASSGLAADLVGDDSIDVYRVNSGAPVQIAELSQATLTQDRLWTVDLSGRTAVATSDAGVAYVFDVPTDTSQPAIANENFEDGSANGWQPHNVSFWTVVSAPYSKVYRQSDFSSASSIWSDIDWKDEAIEADATITVGDGGKDRWVGVATRYQDSNNYYYLSLRTSNQLQLRKKVNGAFTTLASATLPVQFNHAYRLRIEAVGSEIRGYVDGKLALKAIDRAFKHGHPALLSYGVHADFDNVRVTPNQLTTLFSDNFALAENSAWVKVAGNWVDSDDQHAYSQTDTRGNTFTYTGANATDQVVEAKVSGENFNSGEWVGVMARYVDRNNFYYLRLDYNVTVSLRKFVNGSFVELAHADPGKFANGTWYTVRLEVVGTTLRGYINGQCVIEAEDSSIAAGKYGLATSKMAAKFDDFSAQRP